MIALFLLLVKNTFSIAQNINANSLEITEKPDQPAQFQGGMSAFGKFLQKNLKYHKALQEANVPGKIYIKFSVEADGTLGNYSITKSTGFGLDEEVIRVLKLSPKWIPAKRKGKPLRSDFILPIPCISLSE